MLTSYPSQYDLHIWRNWCQQNLVREQMGHPVVCSQTARQTDRQPRPGIKVARPPTATLKIGDPPRKSKLDFHLRDAACASAESGIKEEGKAAINL